MLLALLACIGDDVAIAPLEGQSLASAAEHPDATATADGVFVTWVERTASGTTAWLQHVPPEGDDPPAPVALPADAPLAGLARKPQVAAFGARVAVTWSSGDPRASEVGLALADSPGGPFDTRIVAVGDASSPQTFVDQPDVAFAPDGELWATWKAEVDHPRVQLVVGRSSSDFAGLAVDPFPGTPCECCPHTVQFAPSGDAVLTIRNNVRDLREIHVARAAAGTTTFDQQAQVSTTGWVVQGCPFDGPATAVLDDERIVVAWVDPTTGTSRPWTAASDDGGATWSEGERILDADGAIYRQPSIAHGDGRVAIAVEDIWTGAHVVVGGDGAWEEVELDRALFDVEIVHTATGFVVIGVDEAGALWTEPVSAPR